MKEKEPRGLPPCSLSAQCLRLLDELDSSNDSFASMDDIQDERMLAQLREHIPTCPTCTATLAQARHIRAQQRAALRELLTDSELKVPSTTSQILAAIHSEERSSHQATADLLGFPLEETEITPQPEQLNGWHTPSAPLSFISRPRMILRNVLTLAAVAALILASIALFGHLVMMRSHPSGATTPLSATKIAQQATELPSQTTPSSSPSQTPSAPVLGKSSTPVPTSNGWNSVMIASTTTNGSTVSNYNYQSGASVQLTSQQLPAHTQFDGVSPDGKNLLYQFSSNDHTMYFTLSQSPNMAFFELEDNNAGNAIWFDSRNVLIETVENGVLKVDTLTGEAQSFLPTLKNASLKLVRNGFLYYFIGGQNSAIGALYVINLDTGEVQPLTSRSQVTSFWLSPDGSMIYFRTSSPGRLPGIYAVNSDGTNSPRMLPQNGVPIGYASDNSLLIMREVNSNFEVVKVGATPAQDQVVSADVAPDAISICTQAAPGGIIPICDNAVSLAPDGHALIVQANYGDGSRQVLSVDLTTGKQVALQVPASNSVLLIGWDKLSVPQG